MHIVCFTVCVFMMLCKTRARPIFPWFMTGLFHVYTCYKSLFLSAGSFLSCWTFEVLTGSDLGPTRSDILSASFIIPPDSTKLKGGYTGFTLSVCLSVRSGWVLYRQLELTKLTRQDLHHVVGLFILKDVRQSLEYPCALRVPRTSPHGFLSSLVIQSIWICCLRMMGISVK